MYVASAVCAWDMQDRNVCKAVCRFIPCNKSDGVPRVIAGTSWEIVSPKINVQFPSYILLIMSENHWVFIIGTANSNGINLFSIDLTLSNISFNQSVCHGCNHAKLTILLRENARGIVVYCESRIDFLQLIAYVKCTHSSMLFACIDYEQNQKLV